MNFSYLHRATSLAAQCSIIFIALLLLYIFHLPHSLHPPPGHSPFSLTIGLPLILLPPEFSSRAYLSSTQDLNSPIFIVVTKSSSSNSSIISFMIISWPTSFTGPNILLNTFLSKILNLSSFSLVNNHVWIAYITTGLKTVLYTFGIESTREFHSFIYVILRWYLVCLQVFKFPNFLKPLSTQI